MGKHMYISDYEKYYADLAHIYCQVYENRREKERHGAAEDINCRCTIAPVQGELI